MAIPDALATHLTGIGRPIPPPVTGFALIDTGASRSAVDANVVSGLGVNPIGVTTVFTPQGSAQQELFPAKFSFPGTPLPEIHFSSVLGSALQGQWIIALLGRDVPSSFILIYNGVGGYISLAY